jgi:hypothetical protein
MVHLDKQGLELRLKVLRSAAIDARDANQDFRDETEPATQARKAALLCVANANIGLTNEALETIGCGPNSHLQRLFQGADFISAGAISIDPDDLSVTKIDEPSDPDGPGGLRLANAILVICELANMRIEELTSGATVVQLEDVPGLVEQIKASQDKHESETNVDGDCSAYADCLRRIARDLVKGSRQDLEMIGELTPPKRPEVPQVIDLTGGKGGTTLTFNIPFLSQPRLAVDKDTVSPGLKAGAIHAAEFEDMLADVALVQISI